LELDVNGTLRHAFVFPPRTNSSAPPLLLAFHGYNGAVADGQDAEEFFHFARVWPEALVIYPQGLPTPSPANPQLIQPGWQYLPDTLDDRDVFYTDALVDWAAQEYGINTNRVFATGFSNGGVFSLVLLDVRPQRFAAFATVSAVSTNVCDASAPRPVVFIYGANDLTFPQSLALETAQCLLTLNRFGGVTQEWRPGYTLYLPDTGGAPIVGRVHPGGHVWPTDVTHRIVEFLRELP